MVQVSQQADPEGLPAGLRYGKPKRFLTRDYRIKLHFAPLEGDAEA
jgi:hypothetical protein